MNLRDASFSLACAAVLAMQLFCANADEVRFREFVIPDQSGGAVTVLGPIEPRELGATLMHEHLYLRFWIPLDEPARWNVMGIPLPASSDELDTWNEPLTQANREELVRGEFFLRNKDAWMLEVPDTLPEVLAYKELGGRTIVDMPPIEDVRDPSKLVELAEKAGVHIVVGTAFYTPAWHPANIDELSVDDLTEFMVRDIVSGMDGTHVKAGIIGEVPADDLELDPPNHETRILRASGRAGRLTGAAVSLHYTVEGQDVSMLRRALDILEDEGLDLSRVAIGHLYVPTDSDGSAVESLFEEALDRGAYLQFDLLGSPWGDSMPTVHAIAELIEDGHSSRILLSHDIYSKFQVRKFGGEGLTYIQRVVIPELRKQGAGDDDIRNIMEENPRRVLTFVRPAS